MLSETRRERPSPTEYRDAETVRGVGGVFVLKLETEGPHGRYRYKALETVEASHVNEARWPLDKASSLYRERCASSCNKTALRPEFT